MPSYLISIDFRIAFAKCDPTPDQKPPGIPEEIAALNPQIVLHCIKEDAGANRTYSCALVYDADPYHGLTDHGLIEHLSGMFNHLPGFEIIASSVDVKPEPIDNPVDGQVRQFNVRCHFRSRLPMDVLASGFAKHVANGHMSPNGMVHLEYVAWMTLNALVDDDVPEMVDSLLARAFDAETEESAVNFQPITTTLL